MAPPGAVAMAQIVELGCILLGIYSEISEKKREPLLLSGKSCVLSAFSITFVGLNPFFPFVLNTISTRQGLVAISPLFVVIGLFLGLGIAWGDFYRVPLIIVFVLAAAYALLITRHSKTPNDVQPLSVADRVRIFSHGAGHRNLMMMLWIFLLAGAFAEGAKQMGAIDATVNLTLTLLPPSLLLPGLFLAACFVSLSIGTSVGTIVALVPVASGLAEASGIAPALLVASVVGGSFFGDNLSFISDTTIVATRSQGVALSAKFRANLQIALPAAIVCFAAYVVLGSGAGQLPALPPIDVWKVLPYVVVLVVAVAGLDVMLVLFLGNALVGLVGLLTGSFEVATWFAAMNKGVSAMSETIMVALLAGGLMEVVRHNGGIDFLIQRLTRHVSGKRGAEGAIAMLVSLTNCVTANNTVAILAVGKISNDIAERFGVDKRKSASLLDTFSCVVQGLLPYGAQLLIAAGLSSLSPLAIIPYLYYNFVLGLVALGGILLRYPRRYS